MVETFQKNKQGSLSSWIAYQFNRHANPLFSLQLFHCILHSETNDDLQ